MAGNCLALNGKWNGKGYVMMINDLKVKIYADGADIQEMKKEYAKGIVKGFTTNPTLMKKAGITSYSNFSKEILKEITELPISMEVFSDDFDEMGEEAHEISSWGENVFVKIPITNSRGESSVSLIRNLSEEGLKLNITAIFTLEQTKAVLDVLKPGTENIISIFAGRIMDAGVDAEEIMKEAAKLCREKGNAKLLWASCREVFNIVQANRCGVDIITVTNDILAKLGNWGKSLEQFSLETVQMFARDSKALGFSIL